MNAREHFKNIVVPNYNEFVRSPSDFRLLENALFSMSTVAERLALERREYGQVGRGVLYGEAQKIRGDLSGLSGLQSCTNALKHVRSIKDHGGGEFTTIATSTGIEANDPTTWKIGGHDLVKVVHNAFATLKGIPELK
jgi:hypothetical protein